MKKLVSLFLALVLSLGLCVPALAADFIDVPTDHAFYDAIMDCAGKGIVGGYNDGTFRPGNTVTRSNFCIMLSRAFYAEDVAKYTTAAALVQDKFWPNYTALILNGAVTNTTIANCYGNAAEMSKGISRFDMAQLMANIMKNKGFTVSDSEKTAAQARIADYSAIPDQYKDAVAAVYALGIIGGYSDGTFGGEVTMNRGQAAVVIYRLAQYVGDGSGAGPETSVDTDPANVLEDPAGLNSSETAPNTPADLDQSKPETPVTPTGRTLANGKAITEANVTEILNQLKVKYPTPTDFSNGYAGLGTGRSPYNNCIAQVTSQYRTDTNQRVSTSTGCGGCAAFIADEIFGQTGVTWNKTTIANVRPGDLLIIIDDNGYLEHVSICVGHVDGNPPTTRINVVDATGNPYRLAWNRLVTSGINIDVWTAYPN